VLKWPYLCLAYICIAIAFLGVVTPGLPTTEFVLIAAWAAGKSSPRLQQWLHSHKLFGPPLKDWHNDRVVALKYKIISACTMIIGLIVMCLFVTHIPSVVLAACGMGIGAIWIWSRPSRSSSNNENQKCQ
jgi:uncharacterized membrane protein YbaN (DUF454 family)